MREIFTTGRFDKRLTAIIIEALSPPPSTIASSTPVPPITLGRVILFRKAPPSERGF
jgi:hypothetical protein